MTLHAIIFLSTAPPQPHRHRGASFLMHVWLGYFFPKVIWYIMNLKMSKDMCESYQNKSYFISFI